MALPLTHRGCCTGSCLFLLPFDFLPWAFELLVSSCALISGCLAETWFSDAGWISGVSGDDSDLDNSGWVGNKVGNIGTSCYESDWVSCQTGVVGKWYVGSESVAWCEYKWVLCEIEGYDMDSDWALCKTSAIRKQYINSDWVVIGTLQAGGAQELWKTPNTHTTLTNVSGAVNTEEALDARGECKGEVAGRWLGPRKVSLNVLHRVRTQPKSKTNKTTTNSKHYSN